MAIVDQSQTQYIDNEDLPMMKGLGMKLD